MSARFAWTDGEVRRALELGEGPADAARSYGGVSTDTRTLKAGDLYVALVGERFDGHEFLDAAFAAGAAGAVVSRSDPAAEASDRPLYRVEDTLVALGRLATHRRLALPAHVVGITGSSGKTSTKELTAAALGAGLRVHATRGNLNNRIGVPLTLLAAPEDAQVVVAEMGTNEPGEIATLAAIARPETGVVTTVGESHLEKLGSIEGVLREKLSLLEGLVGERRGVVGDEPPALPEGARRILPDARVAGWSGRADEGLRPEGAERDGRGAWRFTFRGHAVRLAMPGRHAVTNALLALAVAEGLGVDPAAATGALSGVGAGAMRGEVRRLGALTLVVDCYNANPQSVAGAAETLEGWAAPARVAVLGTMLELGGGSDALHARVLAEVISRNLELIVATGGFARAAASLERRTGGPELVIVDDPEAAYEALRPRLRGDEVVLLKGSRGVRLERLIPRFETDFGAAEGES